ncbi:hypothetical protein [Bradyrhizobium zhanjiangense]|uniref:Terminase small subunit n=1 Tax=Bradyrhizobium zhanjiangense TaxID=1325107 RepID=A0ABY0DAP7_9BRAD|nr:hypothetical protein [Bradyrhizobium zhanjiangense]RXG86496.1 hypothetical protein EAS62_37270 [Bradyrhizobium zhanjiangense]
MDNQESTTPEAARDRLAELKADTKWRDAFVSGNGPQVSEFRRLSELAAKATDRTINDAIAGKAPSMDQIFIDPQMRDATQTIEALRGMGIHEESVARSVLDGSAVSADERHQASIAKDRLMKDVDWTKKYLAGDGEARRQMGLLNVILTRSVKESAA